MCSDSPLLIISKLAILAAKFLRSIREHARVRVPLVLQNKDSTGDQKKSAKELGEYYEQLAKDFDIISIEDGFDQVGGRNTNGFVCAIARCVLMRSRASC